MIKQRKLNKLTPIFELTPYIVASTKRTLIKAKGGNRDHVVTRNISDFRRVLKDAVFPNSTSHGSYDDFEYIVGTTTMTIIITVTSTIFT